MRNLLLFLCLVTSLGNAQWAKTPLKAPEHLNPNLYAADADARREIAEAIVAAGKENKRVLLIFGGNWCLDCHILDNAFHNAHIASVLNQNFEVVHVDIGEGNKNLDLVKKYNIPLEKGVPSVAVLNRQGRRLYSSAEFEKARSMTEEDVLAFLNLWKPPSEKEARTHAK
jgi:thiol:disulfide interchange protein